MSRLPDQPFFQPGSADEPYERLRDGADPENRSARARVEDLWAEYEPYAPPRFRELARADLLAAFWQMYLGCTFLRRGKLLARSSGSGPDLRMEGDRPIWVEATAPARFDSPARPAPRPTSLAESPETEIMTRYARAVTKKRDQLNGWLAGSVVGSGEPYVVGVNAGRFASSVFEIDLSAIMRATLGMGHLPEERLPDGRVVHDFDARLPEPTDLLHRPEFEGVSAVVWSPANPYWCPGDFGSEFIWVFNSIAANRLDPSEFPFGRAYWMEGRTLGCKNHERR
jgi:hypothetical protein